MRVLVIPSWYPSDETPTAGIFVKQQVRAISGRTDVAVMHVDPGMHEHGPSPTVEDGITVVRSGIVAKGLRARYFGYRSTGLAAYQRLSAEWGAPDIIHVQALWPAGLIARDVSRQSGVPFVVTEHSEEYLAQSRRRLVRTPGMVPLVLRPLARSAAAYVAVSAFLAGRLEELGLARGARVIPNVVPESAALPLPTEPPFVVAHVSVMGAAKNLDELLRAVALLRDLRSDFRLRLAGDGECRAKLEGLSTELGLGDTVEFVGRIDPSAVPDFLARAAFTVVSSTHETFSVSAAESLMCGRPVLSTRCGGPEEFVTPEVGHLIDGTDSRSLAEGLDWMLGHFGEFAPKALHDYAMRRFAPDAVAEQILDVYRSVLDA